MTRQLGDISCWHINYKHLSSLADFPKAETGRLFFNRTVKVCNGMLTPVVHFVFLFISPNVT